MKVRDKYITTEDVTNLRDNTPVGSLIMFNKFNGCSTEWTPLKATGTVRGIVTAKYDHIFVINNNDTYSWVDYILGRVE